MNERDDTQCRPHIYKRVLTEHRKNEITRYPIYSENRGALQNSYQPQTSPLHCSQIFHHRAISRLKRENTPRWLNQVLIKEHFISRQVRPSIVNFVTQTRIFAQTGLHLLVPIKLIMQQKNFIIKTTIHLIKCYGTWVQREQEFEASNLHICLR